MLLLNRVLPDKDDGDARLVALESGPGRYC
jgi:hypothetical protein